jgi:type I restriction enzyme S subunit
MSELPRGWVATTLGTVAPLFSGSTPKGVLTAQPGTIPFYKVADMNTSNGHLMAGARVTVAEEVATALSLRICPSGSVIFPKVGGALHTNKKRILTRPAAFDTNTMAAVPTSAIDEGFLYYWLSSIKLSDYAYGSPVPQVSRSRLSDEQLLLPPAEEQRRIVAVIEEQFSRLDAGAAALERAAQNLKRMRAAVLQAAVTGQLVPFSDEDVSSTLNRISNERNGTWQAATNKPYREPAKPAAFPLSVPKHWRIASLEAITDPIRVICYGILMPKENIKDGVPYVRVKDMKDWTIDIAGLNRTSPEIAAKYARASLQAGDLLLAIRGSYGRVAIIPPELSGGNITQDSARIASHPDIDHRYLLYYLGGSVANRYYAQVARGVAVKGVNIGDLKSMPVPIPPRREQEAIADEVERQFTLLNSAEVAVQVQTRHSQSLRASILTTAFSGKLVPQDPNDEPASVLIERIAAERASSDGHNFGRARRARMLRAKDIV